MNQRELKQSIEEDPNLTDSEKARKLNALCAPYTKMSDAELLQLVRDFTMESVSYTHLDVYKRQSWC